MSTVAQDYKNISNKIAAINSSIAQFTTIKNGISSLIVEYTSNSIGVGASLYSWEQTIWNGAQSGPGSSWSTGGGWINDRARYLTSLCPTTVTTTTKITSWSVVYPSTVTSYTRKVYEGNLAGWSIYPNLSANPNAAPQLSEVMDSYSFSHTLSAMTVSPSYAGTVYTRDVYDFYKQNKSYIFVCQYLWRTPATQSASPYQQCNGLYYSLSSMTASLSSQTNQLSFETSKLSALSIFF